MNDEERIAKNAIAVLAGDILDLMTQRLSTGGAKLHCGDAVFAASLAIKAIGMLSMQLDSEPMTPLQIDAELLRIFLAASSTTVIPIAYAEGETPVSSYHTKQ
jgi:hypothetical protein